MLHQSQHTTFRALVLCLWVGVSVGASAAELRGTVTVQQTGLFSARSDALKEFPVSVALYPAEGQPLPRFTPVKHDMLVLGSQIQPLYLAVPRGDRLRFQNRDSVYHELFTHSRSQPLDIKLDREGLGRETTVSLNDVADLHWFCRIHAKTYARIDVLDTPLIRMIHAGESFEFRDLQPGKWTLRIAAPGAETKTLEAQAVTAPPPLRVQLAVKGFSQTGMGVSTPRTASMEQLFPGQPGF